jgi:hypothetical protein
VSISGAAMLLPTLDSGVLDCAWTRRKKRHYKHLLMACDQTRGNDLDRVGT